MKRRKLLKKSILLSAAGLIGASGVWMINGYDVDKLTIEQAIKDLQQINANTTLKSVGWDLSQIFNHLAQSVEYSMSGYPEHQSESFKATIGQSAFTVFSIRGKMTHDLNEPIPGAPRLQANGISIALNRLLTALQEFKSYQSELKPHFAYGELTYEEYTIAHVMHINNHLEVLTSRT